MIKKYFSLGLAALCFGAGSLLANPLVILPRGDFSCEVEVSAPGASDPAKVPSEQRPLEIKKIVITRVGPIRRDTTHWSDGTTTELWNLTDKKVALFEGKKKGENNVVLLQGEYRQAASPQLLNFDEASVAWISEKSAQKPATDGPGTIYYRSQVTLKEATGDEPPETALYQAWIDSKTLMPKKLDDGSSVYTLNFSKSSPEGGLVLPAHVKAELDLWIKASAGHAHR